MTAGEAVRATLRSARVPVIAVAVYGAAVAGIALSLWGVLLGSLGTPCVVPSCTWPRLSAAGLDALGAAPSAWTVLAGTLTLLWILVPFGLGVVVLRGAGAPWIAGLWFSFALGPVSAVPDGPLATVLRVISLGAWFGVFAIFPTGTFRPTWIAIAPATAIVWTLALELPAVSAAEAANDPFLWALEAAVYVACVGVLVAGQIVQFRRLDASARRALGLILVPFGLLLAGGAATAVVNARVDADALGYGTLGGALLYELSSFLTILLISCAAVAIVRHGAYGVRVALDRVLVATIALVGTAAVYALVVAVASRILVDQVPQIVAAAVTAAALAGVYGRLSRAIGRLVFGDADDPAAVSAALGATVAAARTPEQLLPEIAATLADRLRFAGIGVHVDGVDAASAVAGRLDGPVERVSLVLDGDEIASVDVGLRPGQRRLTPRDRRAVAAASGPVAAALTATRLNDDLRRSRLEVLVARDDERRALRRRLHDEVGPTLALAGHRIAAARDDPAQLGPAAETLADAVAQVRAVSRELRPPALDDLGLEAALVAFASGLGLTSDVEAPARIHPGVVEVAVYRIVVEALVNAARHAEATRVRVAVALSGGAWVVCVDDDGRGMRSDAAAGVGTQSMCERAVELGGALALGASPLGGVRVRATLPRLPGASS